MAFVVISHLPSRETYDAVIAEIGNDTQQGCIVHTACEVDGRVHVVDVWESKDCMDEFYEQSLGPAMAKLQVELAEPPEQAETFNVHRAGHPSGEQAAFNPQPDPPGDRS